MRPKLQASIDELVARRDARRVEQAARRLSHAYRAGDSRVARDADAVAAYLITRAPATYAAVEAVLGEIRVGRPDWTPDSLLDLGAGPGVAAWAATEAWPSIAAVELVEVEPEPIAAGRELAAAGAAELQRAAWLTPSPGRPLAAARGAGLVIASYLLGEIPTAERETFVGEAWEHTVDTLVVVEPGTPAGYERVLAVRDTIIAAGGHVVAPCPHERACPLTDSDWCHFGVRLARSAEHRRAKGAVHGFEDEKFSYVALARAPAPLSAARVLRRPDKRQGHVVLDLCSRGGLERRTVSRRDGEAYRRARKLTWGDATDLG